MATLTKAELRVRILQSLGVLAIGQSATAADADLVDEAIDAAHDRLKGENLADYATSAIPEWAQTPLRDYVSYDLKGAFGLSGARLQQAAVDRQHALHEMRRQLFSERHPVSTEMEPF